MTLALRLISLAGLLVFAPLFAATFISPIHIERAARGFIENEIESYLHGVVGAARENAGETPVGRLAAKLAEQHKEKLNALKERLSSGLNERIAAEVARLQDLSCECRALLRQGLDAIAAAQIAELESAEPQLRKLIEGRYVELATGLMLDVRIFAGTNAAAFLILLALSITRRDRIRPLLIPGLLLAAANAIATIFYIFGQNWFFAVMYADYMGWAYTAWVLVIFGFLCDVALNKARVTTRILDMFSSAAASVPSPC